MPQRICTRKSSLQKGNTKGFSNKNLKLPLHGSNNNFGSQKVSTPTGVVTKVKQSETLIDGKWKTPSKIGRSEYGKDKLSEHVVYHNDVPQMCCKNTSGNSVDASQSSLNENSDQTSVEYGTSTSTDKVIYYTISQSNKLKDKQSLQKSRDHSMTINDHNTNISIFKDTKNFQSQINLKNTTQSTTQHELFRDRSIEETEAAHDLLSLSQSLPPLPAPCVVTILNPDQNYDPNVNEISTSYVTYNNQNNTRSTIEIHYKIDKVNESTSHSSHPPLSYSNDNNQSRENVSPLTPPASESSSDTEQSSSYLSESSNSTKSVKRKSKNSKSNRNGEAKVYAMTIFDSVMINDGRTKKGNGEAEIIHVEEKRQGRYKCPQCGKQYATSSNLSRHKQTHRSLDSQSAKKCNTCGKAYVSMPALAMHLLTHKLTHSCGVCGKLFSRPWLLQGHLRSHSGEKPYACAHCGKAFADRSNLRAHMQTHSINKQYECARCRKTFALKSYLTKHLESSCLKDEFKKCFEDDDIQHIEDDDNFDEDEDIIVT